MLFKKIYSTTKCVQKSLSYLLTSLIFKHLSLRVSHQKSPFVTVILIRMRNNLCRASKIRTRDEQKVGKKKKHSGKGNSKQDWVQSTPLNSQNSTIPKIVYSLNCVFSKLIITYHNSIITFFPSKVTLCNRDFYFEAKINRALIRICHALLKQMLCKFRTLVTKTSRIERLVSQKYSVIHHWRWYALIVFTFACKNRHVRNNDYLPKFLHNSHTYLSSYKKWFFLITEPFCCS